MNLSDDAKKIYELNFSVVKPIATMLFITHGTGLVTLFATDAVKYKEALFWFGVGFIAMPSLLLISYLCFIKMLHTKGRTKFITLHKISHRILIFSLVCSVIVTIIAINEVFLVLKM